VGASNRGYEIIGNQGLEEGMLPDLKEVSVDFLFPASLFRLKRNHGLLDGVS
jgi:hypothetical protein